MKYPLMIKVCGMKFPENIQAVAALCPEFMGFIFYPKSPRYAEPQDEKVLQVLPRKIMKIGVFVNETLDEILSVVKKYSLQGVQLHGTEPDDLCYTLRAAGLIVIKAFAISGTTDFKATDDYEGTCDFFLFDTKTPAHGGSGVKFDWSVLSAYVGGTRFILSGGISVDDLESIKQINHPKLAGVDLNSKFEVWPGEKDVALLEAFISGLKE
ncbi:MAG: phosphoribosylanthranilate isomerase [Bacteroidota bacterium]|nr:phosphoribosylanthranilate isomerase [Bacteroidota bacterium]